MKKSSLSIIATAIFACTLFIGAGAAVAAQATVIKLATVQNEQHPYAIMSDLIKKRVEERTKGAVKVELYHNGSLGDERAILEGMQFDTIGMGITTSGSAGNFLPEVSVFEMPFLFSSEAEARKVVDGPVGQKIIAKFDNIGFKGLAFAEQGFRNLTNSKRPVKTADDMNGLKIRVMENELAIAVFNALGANATPMAWGECMTALQQKTIDGQENPMNTVYTFNLYESQQYMTLTRHTYSAAVVLMSKNLYDSLSKEVQTIVAEAVNESIVMERNMLDVQVAEHLKALKDKGMIVEENPDLQSFKDKLKGVTEKYGTKFETLLAEIENAKKS
jgi:tripartite ATP-independent transporter DctP family solute receptor